MNLKQNSQHFLKAKITDFYSIVPIPDTSLFLILIGDEVVGSIGADSLDEAEEYVLQCYEELAVDLSYFVLNCPRHFLSNGFGHFLSFESK